MWGSLGRCTFVTSVAFPLTRLERFSPRALNFRWVVVVVSLSKYEASAMVPLGISDLQTAFNGITSIVNGIDRIIEYRAEKRRQKEMRARGQQAFLHHFSFALAPDENAQEEETIRSYCKKLQDILRAHCGFIFGRGQYNTQAAHATMATFLFQFGALPWSTPSQNTRPAIARLAFPLYYC